MTTVVNHINPNINHVTVSSVDFGSKKKKKKNHKIRSNYGKFQNSKNMQKSTVLDILESLDSHIYLFQGDMDRKGLFAKIQKKTNYGYASFCQGNILVRHSRHYLSTVTSGNIQFNFPQYFKKEITIYYVVLNSTHVIVNIQIPAKRSHDLLVCGLYQVLKYLLLRFSEKRIIVGGSFHVDAQTMTRWLNTFSLDAMMIRTAIVDQHDWKSLGCNEKGFSYYICQDEENETGVVDFNLYENLTDSNGEIKELSKPPVTISFALPISEDEDDDN